MNEAGRILEPEPMWPRPSELSLPWGTWMSSGLLQVVLSGPAILHSSRFLFHKQADITGRGTWQLEPSMLHQGPWDPGSQDVPGDAAWRLSVPTQPPGVDLFKVHLPKGCRRWDGGTNGFKTQLPTSSIMHVTIVSPSDHTYYPYCPNLAMFSKPNTATVKSKGNLLTWITFLKWNGMVSAKAPNTRKPAYV